ncbi:MAG: DUF2027 domain-containing protein [Prevotella sp.]|nr:DUF2027 domain-containing protein [Prevotella sp.]
MRIGDTVRFLNEIGGGKVAGFKGNNIVLVEDEDGFQIPMNINEVVVAKAEDYSTSNAINRKSAGAESGSDSSFDPPGNRSVSALLREGQDEDIDMTVDDTIDDSKEVTFRFAPREREGGHLLSAYLVFVPATDNLMADPRFDLYLVNDSNFFMRYVYAAVEETQWSMKYEGEIEPNTKICLGNLVREDINAISRVNVQLLAFKRDTAYELKPSVDATLRIDPVRFFKTNAFRVNPFFDTPALVYPIIEDDKVPQPHDIDAQQLKEAMYKDAPASQPAAETITAAQREKLVQRYADDQRKGGRGKSPFGRQRDLDDAVVIDLHAEQVLDTTRGMKSGEILEYQLKIFRDTLAEYSSKRGQKIVFIHGKGEGVLRRAIVNELSYKYKGYTFQDASFQEYGYGATMVTIK